MKVSVIIPVYNAQEYLQKCLDSIVNQTLNQIEIILINDGSTDNSLEICRLYCENYKQIKLINQENKGVSMARNIGINHAKGEYISFVDADDWIESDMYNQMYTILESYQANVGVFNCILEKKDKQIYKNIGLKRNIYNHKQIIEEILPKIINPDRDKMSLRGPWIYLYNREFLIKNNLFFPKDIRIGEDFIFNLKVALAANKLVYNNSHFYHYRIWENSSNHKYKPQVLEIYQDIILNIQNILDSSLKIKDERIEQALYNMKIKYINTMLLNECKITQNYVPLKSRINSINNICNSFIIEDIFSYKNFREISTLQKIILFLVHKKMSICLYFIYYFRYRFYIKK